MGLKIIGAGYGRTGTHSLKLALEHLGFGPCHHMFEIRDNPEQLPVWAAAARGEPLDFDVAFRGYQSQVDWPGAHYWRELAEYYPDAKVILTVRDADAWYDSANATIIPFLTERGNHSSAHLNAICEMANALIGPGFDHRLDDREHAKSVFEAHNAEVQAVIPRGRLLVFDAAQGWEPLCTFLGLEVPDRPYPRTNSTKEFVGDEWANVGDEQPPAA